MLEIKLNYKNENVLILNNAKVASTFVNFYIGDGGHALDLSEVIPNQNYINSICDNVKEIICLVKDPNKKLISSLHQIYMTSNTGLSDNAEHIKDKLTGISNGDVSEKDKELLKNELVDTMEHRKTIEGEFFNETHASLHHLSLNLFLTQLIVNGFDTNKITVVDITNKNIWFDEYISSGYTKMINPSNDVPEILDKNVTPTESKNLITNILSEIRSSEKNDSIFLREYLEIEYKHYNFLKKTYINK